MTQYRKKPAVVEAVQTDGSPESNRAIIDWTRSSATPASMDTHPERGRCLTIATLEGAHWVSPGDWIIRGVAGEFYPCKPEIFAATYEPADTPTRDVTSELSNMVGRLVGVMKRSDEDGFGEAKEPVSGDEWFDAIEAAEALVDSIDTSPGHVDGTGEPST